MMNKEKLIDQMLNTNPFPGIPEHFWIGTAMQQAAIKRFIMTEKFLYDPNADNELKEYSSLIGVPLNECVFDRSKYEFIKSGKDLPRGNYYAQFKELWIRQKK